MFIPAGLEQHEAGSPLSPRLQPVIILEPSVTHTPLVAGKHRAWGRQWGQQHSRHSTELPLGARQPFDFPFLFHELQLRRWKTLILVPA